MFKVLKMAKVSSKTVSKVVKKKWFKIYAPQMLGNAFVGESFVDSQERLLGKSVKVNLGSLTNKSKNSFINVKLKCDKLLGKDGVGTSIIDYSMSPSAIKRMVRLRRDRLDASFVCETKDKKYVRVKYMIITVSNASSSKKTLIRNAARALIARYVMSLPYEDFVNNVIGFAMQSEMRKALSKIYPIKSVDIRQFTLVEKKSFTVVEKGEGFDVSKLQTSKTPPKEEEESDGQES